MLLLLCSGNEHIHDLTAGRHQVLRIDMRDWHKYRRFAKYNHFRVGSEANKFRLLSVGSYSGTAGK